MYTIENDRLKISIKQLGAELCSMVDKYDHIEHIWQADPAYWPWHAPMLFPIIGVSENNELRIKQKTYPMEKHGFARKSLFQLIHHETNECILSLSSSSSTLDIYPYQFELQVKYLLVENTLQITYSVINTDPSAIYFSIGGHPALALAFYKDDRIEDYYLSFEKNERIQRHHINKSDGMFNGESSILLDQERIIPITATMFEKDAYIFKDHQSRSIEIKSHKHAKSIKVDFKDFNYLGLWAIPGAKYVCIEPWLGCADTKNALVDIQNKEGIIMLEPKKSFSCTYSIQIN